MVKTIGLAGGSGSGKSAAAQILHEMGAEILDADALILAMQAPGEAGYRVIEESFGPAYFLPDGQIDRKMLGELIFSNEAQRQRLNGLLWPLVLERVQEKMMHAKGVLVMDAPLLFESGMDALCEEIWLVDAPEALRLKRIMQRDGLDEAAARARMQAQGKEAAHYNKADRIIDGALPLTAMKEQLREAFEDFCPGGGTV